MKRGMELIRLLLLNLESEEEPNRHKRTLPSGYDKPTVDYHYALLIEAGLVDGKVVKGNERIVETYVSRLTWNGHEFLDAARNETGWRHVTHVVGKIVGTVFFFFASVITKSLGSSTTCSLIRLV